MTNEQVLEMARGKEVVYAHDRDEDGKLTGWGWLGPAPYGFGFAWCGQMALPHGEQEILIAECPDEATLLAALEKARVPPELWEPEMPELSNEEMEAANSVTLDVIRMLTPGVSIVVIDAPPQPGAPGDPSLN